MRIRYFLPSIAGHLPCTTPVAGRPFPGHSVTTCSNPSRRTAVRRTMPGSWVQEAGPGAIHSLRSGRDSLSTSSDAAARCRLQGRLSSRSVFRAQRRTVPRNDRKGGHRRNREPQQSVTSNGQPRWWRARAPGDHGDGDSSATWTTASLSSDHRGGTSGHGLCTVRFPNTARPSSRSGSTQTSVPDCPQWHHVRGDRNVPVQWRGLSPATSQPRPHDPLSQWTFAEFTPPGTPPVWSTIICAVETSEITRS